MAHDKAAVQQILDKAKADGRTSLTAPEGKLVCDAYGITVPKEGVATTAAEAAKLAAGMGFPVVLKIVSPEILHKTEAGGVLVGVKSAADVEAGFATIMANAKKYDAKANLQGVQVQQMIMGGQEVIIGAVTDPVVRQAGRVRTGRHPGRGAEGHHVPAGTRDEGRRAVDARRHRRGVDPEGRARRRSGEPRRARGADRERVAARRPTSRRSRKWT